MDYYYSRYLQAEAKVEVDLQRSRRYAEEAAQLEIRRSRRVQQALQREEEVRRLSAVQKLRADQEYQEYLLRREQQQRQLELEYQRERLIREQSLVQQSRVLQAERRSRIIRQQEADIQRAILLTEEKKRAEFLQASRKIELEAQMKLQDQLTKENIKVKEEQLEQQKLQAQLKSIDVDIGTIYDERQSRRRSELLELEELDQKIFKVKQEMRASKVKQTALEDSLANLSKIIVPGAR